MERRLVAHEASALPLQWEWRRRHGMAVPGWWADSWNAKARLTQGLWHCTWALCFEDHQTSVAVPCLTLPRQSFHTDRLWRSRHLLRVHVGLHQQLHLDTCLPQRILQRLPLPAVRTRELTWYSDVPKDDSTRCKHTITPQAGLGQGLIAGSECAHPLVLCAHPLVLSRTEAATCPPPQAVILALQITDAILKL